MGMLGACILYLGSWALQKAGKQQHLKKFRITTVVILVVVSLVLVILEWEMRTYRVELDWNEVVTIHIKAFEREAFLDNPTDFDFYLYNSSTGQELYFDFHSIDWAAFKFYKVKQNSQWLAIEDQSSPFYWIIDGSSMEIQKRTTEYLKESKWELTEVATLTPTYIFEKH